MVDCSPALWQIASFTANHGCIVIHQGAVMPELVCHRSILHIRRHSGWPLIRKVQEDYRFRKGPASLFPWVARSLITDLFAPRQTGFHLHPIHDI
ncbi:MAG: hypothetical protein AB2L24_00920 [Mangrovibacterium sp.]